MYRLIHIKDDDLKTIRFILTKYLSSPIYSTYELRTIGTFKPPIERKRVEELINLIDKFGVKKVY